MGYEMGWAWDLRLEPLDPIYYVNGRMMGNRRPELPPISRSDPKAEQGLTPRQNDPKAEWGQALDSEYDCKRCERERIFTFHTLRQDEMTPLDECGDNP